MVTQIEIARRVGLDVSSVNKILNRRAGPIFRKETIRKVFKVARELGYDFGKLKHAHRRRDARKDVAIPIELSIYLAEGRLFDQGRAEMRNVSLSGALLSAIVLTKQAIPVVPHTIGIRLLEGPLRDVEVLGRPIRLNQDGDVLRLAIEFLATERAKASRLLSRRA
jgi:transcriptional regulator with XRE-family HTH domain